MSKPPNIATTNSGFHTQNRHQLRILEKIKITKEIPQVPLSDLYMYAKQVWVYKGKTCRLCGIIMDHPTVIDKHRYICKVLNKKKGDD
jgi:formamidopyrimidine-DNA glycosylase